METRAELDQAVRRLRLDRAAVELVEALAEGEIPCVVLKGTTTEALLLERGETRAQLDIDILVRPDTLGRTEEVLTRLGYRPRGPRLFPRSVLSLPNARTWDDGGELTIDLHTSLRGIRVEPASAFERLTASAVMLDLGWSKLPALSPAGRALHIALHAAQHRDPRTKADLELAIERLPGAVWVEAAALSCSLGAEGAFCSGLGESASGAALVQRLGLQERVDAERVLLDAGAVPKGALLLERLLRTPSLKERLRLARQELSPPFSHLAPPLKTRDLSPAARLRAYGGALLLLPRLLLPAALAVWRARRMARRLGGEPVDATLEDDRRG